MPNIYLRVVRILANTKLSLVFSPSVVTSHSSVRTCETGVSTFFYRQRIHRTKYRTALDRRISFPSVVSRLFAKDRLVCVLPDAAFSATTVNAADRTDNPRPYDTLNHRSDLRNICSYLHFSLP